MSRRLLNLPDSPTASRSKSIDRTLLSPFQRVLRKKHSVSALRLDEIKFENIPTVEVDDDDDDNGCDLDELRKGLRQGGGGPPPVRRRSLTAPPSPIARHSPFVLRKPHLPHLPLPHIPGWKDFKGRWGSGIIGRGNESLHRTESMVSLCFKSLSNLIVEDNLPGLQAFLANKQVVVDDKDENGTTALMVAVQHSRSAMVTELITHGADVNIEDNDGWTALLLAAKQGRINICIELLDHGADIQQRDMGGWTALMWAAYKGYEDVVSLLLEKGADVNAHGNYHITSLVWAAGRGYSKIVEILLAAGARPNMGDKYGTTALIWAARKGDSDSVKALLSAGAMPDQAGMYSWTALLQATQGNHIDIVQMLLEHKPNVNALDKDGCTALTLACKEGYYEIAVALLNSGAYINIQDRGGDTCLIHAVKGGHKNVVEALLKKYADVDVLGKDRKTAVYTAIEKGHLAILKLLLHSNPDLELSTKDGDTPLLRAVRSRNAEMVQILLDKKAKVNAVDKRGDSCLHIAMRARSKAIVEIILQNPKNGQLLYRPNRAQETPYNIDMSYPKTIMGQIFGARKLNTNEDNESLLGYELYSSALADMLSEPTLSMPITVGLYARWGSGKSFLLNKLKDEMKNFAKQWEEIVWQWGWAILWGVCNIAVIFGAIVAMSSGSWIIALTTMALTAVLLYVMLYFLWFSSNKYEWSWPYTVMLALSQKFNSLKLVLQIIFCHPPGPQCSHALPAQPIRFHFTDQAKSSTQEGEASVIQMIVSLTDALENQYGRMCTRLYRAFRPKPIRATANWRWRKVCCIPNIIAFELVFLCVVLGICILIEYFTRTNDVSTTQILEGVLIVISTLILLAFVANLYTWGKIGSALFLSPRAHIKKSVNKQPEGFLQALRPEVILLTDMVKCLDAFTGQQTRLVVVVDALDTCEQDRVLIILNAIHTLCSDPHSPFIIILAIDPHIISKAVEINSRRAFSESNIGGWDYLRNMVQLPFYLQNSALRRVKIAQQTSQKKQPGLDDLSASLQRSVSARRLSSASELMSSQEKLKGLGGAGNSRSSRKLKISESVASSMNSNLHKVGLSTGPADLNRVLLTDDYFSDVNPRSMGRLMNVLYITGRLMKAFQIEFNWYHLASWVNLTEQWPFRTSWIIFHHEMYEEHIDDNTSLKNIYEKVRPNIPMMREVEPLMDLDRDERKLEVFLGFHRSSLLVADLKIFLPFTINLDPFIKKVIKDEQQHLHVDDEYHNNMPAPLNKSKYVFGRKQKTGLPPAHVTPTVTNYQHWQPEPPPTSMPLNSPPISYNLSNFQSDLSNVRLSKLSVNSLCVLIEHELPRAADVLTKVLVDQNISGQVLRHCDLNELKAIVNLNFGDWELFKLLIVTLREVEASMPPATSQGEKERPEKEPLKSRLDSQKSKQTNMEKQVTLEEQMICGALQTLNEEALEDVLQGDTTVPAVESESYQLVLLAPTNNSWQSTSPPASRNASPQFPRKTDSSILKSRGSFKHSGSKKHVSIRENRLAFGSDTNLKILDAAPVVVKFENETVKNEILPSPNSEKRKLSSDETSTSKLAEKQTLHEHSPENQESTDTNSKCNMNIVVSEDNVEKMSEKIEVTLKDKPKSRPTSLSLPSQEEDPNQFNGVRSRSSESGQFCLNTNAPDKDNDHASSNELITRIKDKLFSKTNNYEKNYKAHETESDDESTPLMSSDKSSPSQNKTPNAEEERDNYNASTTNDNSPLLLDSSHSRMRMKRDKKSFETEFSPEHYDNSENTLSVEFSPCSDKSSTDSHKSDVVSEGPCNVRSEEKYLDCDQFRIFETSSASDDNIRCNQSMNSVSIQSSHSNSAQSIDELFFSRPRSMSSGFSDSVAKNNFLWRQDAVEDSDDYLDPESSV